MWAVTSFYIVRARCHICFFLILGLHEPIFTLFALQSTAPCPFCGTEGIHHVGNQLWYRGVPHVMRWPRLLSQQRLARHLRWVYSYMHLRGREHSHDAADCKVARHTEMYDHKCDTSPGPVHSLPTSLLNSDANTPEMPLLLECSYSYQLCFNFTLLLFFVVPLKLRVYLLNVTESVVQVLKQHYSHWRFSFFHVSLLLHTLIEREQDRHRDTCRHKHAPTQQPYHTENAGDTPALLPQQKQTKVTFYVLKWYLL